MLSDWDLDGASPRAEVLRLRRDGFARMRARGAVSRPLMRRWWQRLRQRSEQRAVARATIPDALWALTLARYPFLAPREPRDIARAARLSSLFLDSKEFSGAHGLEVSDDMAVAIAAQACLPCCAWA